MDGVQSRASTTSIVCLDQPIPRSSIVYHPHSKKHVKNCIFRFDTRTLVHVHCMKWFLDALCLERLHFFLSTFLFPVLEGCSLVSSFLRFVRTGLQGKIVNAQIKSCLWVCVSGWEVLGQLDCQSIFEMPL